MINSHVRDFDKKGVFFEQIFAKNLKKGNFGEHLALIFCHSGDRNFKSSTC